MKSVLLLTLFLLISSGFGRVLLHRFTVFDNAPLERFAYGTAIALGIAALGVFALGMVGLLALTPVTLWWALLAAIGLPGTLKNGRDVWRWIGQGRRSRGERASNGSADLTYARLIPPVAILVLLAIGLFCIFACFQPPTGHEWDALAYHLADPKVFLSQNRISMLPTEHHSNFPFLMEMLYCVGLLYDNFALANLFHLTTGVLTVAAMVGFCRRLLPGQTGWIAALLLATTPLYLWESCVAYIDVGFGLYVTLAAFAATMMVEIASGDTPDATGENSLTPADRHRRLGEWAMLAGVALGFALGIKYLALIPFALAPLLLVYRRVPLRQVMNVVGIAAVIGCPWYIKNLVLTHNPVYPYLFKLFPASKYWSADRATVYQAEQAGFGYPHALAFPGTPTDNLFQTVSNLLQTPWHLLTDPIRYTNQADFHFMVLLGGLYAAGILPLVFLRKIPRPLVNLLLLCCSQLLAWFFIAQHIRYLVYLLPLAAVVAGYGLSAVSRLDQSDKGRSDKGRTEGRTEGRTARNLRLFPTLCTLVVTGQVLYVMWALCALPTTGKAVAATGMMPTALALGDVLKNATEPETQDEYLKQRLDNYVVIKWINQTTPRTSGVVLYDDVRDFYLDRPYLWGNQGHSSYIPYNEMKDGNDLTVWLRQHGYGYVLINLNGSPHREPNVDFNGREKGEELEYLRKWYLEDAMPGTWEFLLADAMRRRLWTPTPMYGHGVVVLEIVGGADSRGTAPEAGG